MILGSVLGSSEFWEATKSGLQHKYPMSLVDTIRGGGVYKMNLKVKDCRPGALGFIGL